MRKNHVIAGVLVSVSLLFLSACDEPPAFEGGIRCVSEEAIEGVGNSATPVAGVLVSGATTGIPGPQSNLGAAAFSGVTGSFGIDDFPGAQTDNTWSITFNYTPVIPGCGSGVATPYVPPGGLIQNAVCYGFAVDF